MKGLWTLILAWLALMPAPAFAHAFGQRYDLPLPLWLYTGGAGAVVGLSFLVMAMFLKPTNSSKEYYGLDLLRVPLFKWAASRPLIVLIEVVCVMLFGLILSACFMGDPDPFDNAAPTFVWVIWWVGLAFFSALIGNLWDLTNPWRILYDWLSLSIGPFGSRREYPERLGYWPAVVLFLMFAWMELISEGAEKPRNLGVLIIVYSMLCWTGMAVYGRDVWLKHGEVFSVVFGLIARFAPLHGSAGKLQLRWPATGLLSVKALPISQVVFVLLLLTSVTFDGILETPTWQSFLQWVSENQMLRGTLIWLQQSGIDLLLLIKTLALLVLPLVFLSAFLLTCFFVNRGAGGGFAVITIAGWFVLSLVPIAIAYHLSHYLSYLLIAGQNIIPLASDPFGYGWDVFDSKSYRLDIGIVNAKMIWYVAVTSIVAGHVFAVYLAHAMALRVFPSVRQALLSQLPMMVLMVGYTMVSLWILSQPIVA